ncbi:alpha-2,8-sialyltransferase 8F-like [Tachysurus ichikawai]
MQAFIASKVFGNSDLYSTCLNIMCTNWRKNDLFDRVIASYSTSWKKHEKNLQFYTVGHCRAIVSTAVVTRHNSPTGKNITYDADKKLTMEVTPALYNLFPKGRPFKNTQLDSCVVVGNRETLANSSCGKQIDSASYVIRSDFDLHRMFNTRKQNLTE